METVTTEASYSDTEINIIAELKLKSEALGLEHYYICPKNRYEEMSQKDPHFKEECPTYPSMLEKIHAEELRNPLEGAVLVHGFKGNLNDDIKQKIDIPSDIEVMREIIKNGAIVSPGRRKLSPEERIRYGEAPFDLNRVCFEARSGRETDGNYGGAYINSSFFAMPVSGLKGTKVSEDIAFGKNAISVYHEDGISIPLEEGILFLDLYNLQKLLPDIKARAEKINMKLSDYLNNHFRILPYRFRKKEELWEIVTTSIEPAKNVKSQPTIVRVVKENVNKMGIKHALEVDPTVEEKDLGNSSLLSNTLLGSPNLKKEYNSSLYSCLSTLQDYLSTIKEDTEALREFPYFNDMHIFHFLADLYTLTENDSKTTYKFRRFLEIYSNIKKYDQERLKNISEKKPGVVFKENGSYRISPQYLKRIEYI